MGQHTDGVISTVAGTNTIIGYECGWVAAGIKPGDIILIYTDHVFFTIASNPVPISGDYESVTITANYGFTRNNVTYSIVSDFTSLRNLPLIFFKEMHFPEVYSESMRRIDRTDQWVESFFPHLYSYELEFYYGAGRFILESGTVKNVAEGFVTLTDENNNYVEVDSAGTVSARIGGFTAGQISLYEVGVTAGEIVVVNDARTPYRLEREPVITLHYPGQMVNGVTNVDYIVRDSNRKYKITKYAISIDGILPPSGPDVELKLRTGEDGAGSERSMLFTPGGRTSGVLSLSSPLEFTNVEKFVVGQCDGLGISIVTVQLFQA